MNDPSNDERCTLDAALIRINIVERYSRLDSGSNRSLRSRILEVELGVSSEWTRVCQFGHRCSLGDAITLTARRQIRPFLSEYRTPTTRDRKGQENGGFRMYDVGFGLGL